LVQLFLRVHDEGSIACNRLAQWLARQYEQVQWTAPCIRLADLFAVMSEYRQSPLGRLFRGAFKRRRAIDHISHGVLLARDFLDDARAQGERVVDVEDR